MPAFALRLSEAAIWDLIQFLRALTEAEEAKSISGHVEPWRPIVAPDFTFESPGYAQESLNAQRGNRVTLLVLYTLPQSLPRLKALLANEQAFADAGVRVIALPTSTSARVDMQATKDHESFQIAGTDVVTAYAMFARRDPDLHGVAPTHAEFLIDRQGYLRARWPGIADAATKRTSEILGAVEILKHEPAHPAAPEGHVH